MKSSRNISTLPPITSTQRNSKSVGKINKSKFAKNHLSILTSHLKKNSSRTKKSPVKKIIRQGFISKFKDKFSFGTGTSSKITSLLSVKTKGDNPEDNKDVYEKIDILYFPTESTITKSNKSRPFISYNAIINSEEYFKETRDIVTPPKEKQRKLQILKEKENDTTSRKNSKEEDSHFNFFQSDDSQQKIKKMNMRLEFNRIKRENYLKLMQEQANKSYRDAINEARQWKKGKSNHNVKIMKRMPMASLESIRDKMLLKRIKKEKRDLEESSKFGSKISITGKKSVRKPNKDLPEEKNSLESKLPSKEAREKKVTTYQLAYHDTSDIYIAKNFESTEGIGFCYYKGKCYFFGGIGRPYDINTYTFTPKTAEFSILPSKGKASPAGRCFQTMVAKDASIIMFGGESAATGLATRYLLNETWILNLRDNIWEKVVDYDFDEIEPRKHHAVCLMGRNMIVSGGLGYEDKILDDFACFDIETKRWSLVQSKIDGFHGLFNHTMVACYTRKLMKDIYAKSNKSSVQTGPKVILKISITKLPYF